jgi:coatomer subunit beta
MLICSDIQTTWKAIRASLGEIPILASEERLLKAQTEGNPEETEGTDKPKASGGAPRVNADGTYATESAITQSSAKAALEAVQATQRPPLRQLVLDGDFYMATVLSTALAKLVLRYSKISDDEKRINALQTEAMLMIVSIIRVGQSDFVKSKIDNDSKDRLMQNVRVLNDFKKVPQYYKILLEDSRKAYQAMVADEDKKRKEKDDAERSKNAIQVDDVLNIRQFAKKGAVENITDVDDLAKAIAGDVAEDMSSKLSRVVPLTGFSDPVYAEVYVKVHQFDIILDVLLVNQTADTLQNLSVEFATLGDLKVIERPQSFNLGPHAFQSVQSTIKVSSTDTGVIFGNLVYDGASSTETNVVILNDLHVDIMDYIHPAHCTETQFRQMWTEFEWENKVNISHNGGCKTLSEFLKRLMSVTNMANLTPNKSLSEDCQFLSANLYAKTVFGKSLNNPSFFSFFFRLFFIPLFRPF